jgi:cell division protein FtsQ
VANQGRNQTRPLIWEDEAPGESRFRRVQTGVPPNGRALPGMPLEMRDPDDDDAPRLRSTRFGGEQFGAPSGAWWRPASTIGRVFLGLGCFAVIGTLTAGVVAAKTYLGRDSRFRIAGAGNIEATGLTQVSRAEMLPVFGEDIGRNIFFVPLNQRRKELEAIPWVQRATVMRLLPDQIRVSIVERQPVAFVRQGQQVGLVDADGVLLSMRPAAMAQHNYSFPVVTGLNPGDPLSMRKARMAVYERLLAELDANGQHLSEQLSEIDLTDPQDARVLMPEQGMDILGHFGDDRFLERYQRYKAHIAEWRQQYAKLSAVDLRYDNQVVLEMATGTSAVAASVGENSTSDGAQGVAPQAKPSAGSRARTDATQSETAATKPDGIKPAPAQKEKPKAREASVAPAKTSRQKSSSVEALETKQRAIRERAARLRAAHEKAEQKKKRAAAQHTTLNVNRANPASSTHATASVAEGQ